MTGDISKLASLLSDDYTQIGSVESEVFENKNDAVHFIKTTIDQIAGKVDMRNRVKKIERIDPFMLITEHADLYVLTEGEWVFYAKFRASSILQRTEGQWKFLHQHSSMPDIRADEGENIATEKISRENIELRDAIKRRTIELEQKNQELAMEAALERVRTVAMGMRKPDDLPGICKILFNELQSMGFMELRNAMINIHNDEKSTFINYDYSEEIGPSINYLNYNIHPVIEKQIKQIRSTHDAFSETVFRGQDLADWKAFRKRIGEKDDLRIDSVEALYYYFYSIGTGAIGISTFGPISTEKLEQLKRFRNVFEFSYRRYMDVSQAEAQAREAQIETALERVRSRSMAMHSSQELKEVALELRKQMGLLGQKDLEVCAIHLYDDDDDSFESWSAMKAPGSESEILQTQARFPKHGIKIVDELMKHYSNGSRDYVLVNEGEKNVEWLNVIKERAPELHALIMQSIGNMQIKKPKANWSVADFSGGALVMVTYGEPDVQSRNLLRRSANVFEQAYIRFKDLKQAEIQAREAHVEVSLERVRSRSMAMYNSDELLEAGEIIFIEMQKLGIESLTAGYVLMDREGKNGLNYTPNPLTKKIFSLPVIIPHNETIHM
ncbi:MAG: nuclear transport factor 2 family protein, partial [Chitinophagaceae bacterium]